MERKSHPKVILQHRTGQMLRPRRLGIEGQGEIGYSLASGFSTQKRMSHGMADSCVRKA